VERAGPMFQACDFRLLTLACTVEGRRKVWGNLKRAFEPQEFVPNDGAPFLPGPEIRTVRWPRGRIQDNAIWAGTSCHFTSKWRKP